MEAFVCDVCKRDFNAEDAFRIKINPRGNTGVCCECADRVLREVLQPYLEQSVRSIVEKTLKDYSDKIMDAVLQSSLQNSLQGIVDEALAKAVHSVCNQEQTSGTPINRYGKGAVLIVPCKDA